MHRPSHFDTHPYTVRRARPALCPRRHPVGLVIASAGLVKVKLAPAVTADNFSALFSFKGQSAYKPAYPESLSGQRWVARLTTHSPTLQACVGLDAHLHAFVGAQSCMAGVCPGPATGPGGSRGTSARWTATSLGGSTSPTWTRSPSLALGRRRPSRKPTAATACCRLAANVYRRQCLRPEDRPALRLGPGHLSPQRIELISPIGVPSPIPEPTWAMLLIGLAGCAGVCRRKTLLEQRRLA